MIQCPTCGQSVPLGARFCMQCGGALVPPSAAHQFVPSAPPLTPVATPILVEQRRLHPGWIWGGLGSLALLGVILSTSGLLRLGAPKLNSGVTKAQGAMPSSDLLKKFQRPDTGVTLAPAPKPDAAMPEDVRRWLEHLRKTEELRVSLAKEQLGIMMIKLAKLQAGGGMDAIKGLLGEGGPNGDQEKDPDPTRELGENTNQMRQAWGELVQYFRSYPPPDECRAIAAAYDPALSQTSGMMLDILDIISGDLSSPEAAVSKLMGMQGTSAKNIDEKAREADKLVGEICDKYKAQKWFSITGDVGGGGLLGGFGGLGR